MKTLTTGGLVITLLVAGCGPATGRLSPTELGVTARDAYLEGRTRAGTWDDNAGLRWMEGVSISSAGLALPGVGHWRLHYTAPGRPAGLTVTVAPLETSEEERAPVSPPGYTVGQASIGDTWLDSPEVLRRALAARGASPPERVTALLLPLDPLQWIVIIPDEARRWRLDASTGEVVTP